MPATSAGMTEWRCSMLDHVGFPVWDYETSKVFYEKALSPLGYTLIMEVSADHTESGSPAAGFGANGKSDFWIGGEGGLGGVLHVAIAVKDRAIVDPFTKLGGRRPGQRRAWPQAALSSQLLRRFCSRPGWPQHRGGLPRPSLIGETPRRARIRHDSRLTRLG